MVAKRLLVAFALAAALASPAFSQPSNPRGTTKPELYYFVIDRSGSIKSNKLVVPIRGALIQKLGQIPPDAEVRVVLFNQKADRRVEYPKMGTNALGQFSAWFDESFVPQGDTRLFDTVGEVLDEIQQVRPSYRRVELTILSDGIEDPPISTRFRSWRDLEPLANQLKQSDPPFFGTWYTLGFAPPDRPTRGITTQEVPDPKELDLRPQVQLAKADFTVSPRAGTVPLRVDFKDLTKGDVVGFRWEFGDGDTSDVRNPSHEYRRPGRYHPRLTVRNPGGESTRSATEVEIDVKGPPPWWIRPLLTLVAAFLLWVIVVVPLLRPRMTPRDNITIRSDTTLKPASLARKHGLRWLWPRGYLTFGGSTKEIVKVAGLPATGGSVARLHRVFGSDLYVLTVLRDGIVRRIRTEQGLDGRPVRKAEDLSKHKAITLRHDDVIEIAGKSFTWSQPAAPGSRPSRARP